MIARAIVQAARGVFRRLQSHAPEVGAASRSVRTALFLAVFCPMYAFLRLRLLVLGPVEVEGRAFDGAVFRCRLPDLIQMYIHLFGVWEPDVTAFIRRRLSAGDVFIDVGANVGYDTLLASKCVGERGRVVAIEASQAIHAELVENLRRNDSPENVRHVNRAAARERGTIRTYIGPTHNVGLSSTVARRGLVAEADVESMPLADLLEEDEIARARLVKVDVEGAEADVLAGMESFLEQCGENVEIVAEVSPEWWADRDRSVADLLGPFVERGFHVYEIPNNYWPWRYLWPNDVSPPRRVRRDLSARTGRIDIVLSRIDADAL